MARHEASPEPPDARDSSVIHDIGYQRYEGIRLGRRQAVSALYVASMRSAFGLGRSAKAKMLPFGLLGLLVLIGAIFALVRQLTGEGAGPTYYLGIPSTVGLLIVILLAVVSPELVSRDLGNKTLSLYFSRPISRSDYAVAKLAAAVTVVMAALCAPLLIMFLGAVLQSGIGWDGVWDEWQDFSKGVFNAAVYALVLATLSVLLASLTGRRAFAAGGLVAVFLVTTPVAGAGMEIGNGAVGELAGLASPFSLLAGVQRWIFGEGIPVGPYGPVYGLVALLLVVGCAGLFVQRYRKVTA
jgi:ABC-2 type transport system permease protein